jgi:CrcB protein
MGGDRRLIATIFAGGALGAATRTGLVELAPTHAGSWPWTTFGVNVAGCLLLGYLVARLQERLPVAVHRHAFLATGFCGALTTFSTMQLELLRMLDRGELLLAAAYAAGSVIAGFVGVMLGTAVERSGRLTW